jgi:hypothetical protein
MRRMGGIRLFQVEDSKMEGRRSNDASKCISQVGENEVLKRGKRHCERERIHQ